MNRMKSIASFFIIIIMSGLPVCHAESDRLLPVANGCVHYASDAPVDTSVGGLLVKSVPKATSTTGRVSFIKFDLTNVELDIENNFQAVLSLNVRQMQADGKKIQLAAYKWDNNWSNKPWKDIFGDSSVLNIPETEFIASVSVTSDLVGKLVKLDLTSYIIKNITDGTKVFSIALIDKDKTDMLYYFDSLESTTSMGLKPQLIFSNIPVRQKIIVSIDKESTENELSADIYAKIPEKDVDFYTAVYNKDSVLKSIKTQRLDLRQGEQMVDLDIGEMSDDDYYCVYTWKNMNNLTLTNKGRKPAPLKGSLLEYLDKTEADFIPTGLTKEYYMDIIEKCLEAYSVSELEMMNPTSDIQTYSRLISCLAGLISSGRKENLKNLFLDMMTKGCAAIESTKGKQELDFSVKELILAYHLMENNPVVTKELKETWKACFEKIDPYKYYKNNSGNYHNIHIYNMTGEWMRKKFNLSGDDADKLKSNDKYFNDGWYSQLQKFDINGMYMDDLSSLPYQNSILYDLTTRVQMQLITGFSYDGKYKTQFDDIMQKGGLMSLFTQSSAFEMPYGGRSNQYLFNEGLLASNFEYEAVRYKEKGDYKTAGAFKRAAHLASMSINRWLNANKHIKNFYVNETAGTESYGYYNKYMITLGCFILNGYIFADDTIEESVCPAESGGYVLETTNRFNKIIANAAGYSIEIETNASTSYDCNGLGRIHKKGVPTELGLSIPFTKTPGYTQLSGTIKEDISIEAGWITEDDTIQYLSTVKDLEYNLKIIESETDSVKFEITYFSKEMSGIYGVSEVYTVNKDGVFITAKLIDSINQKIFYRIPLLHKNGDNNYSSTTDITTAKNSAKVIMGENSYEVETDGNLTLGNSLYGNRNGEYKLANILSDSETVNLFLSLN